MTFMTYCYNQTWQPWIKHMQKNWRKVARIRVGEQLICYGKHADLLRKTFSLSDTDSDECSSSPCFNAATCVNGFRRFTCVCDRHYTGTHCESRKKQVGTAIKFSTYVYFYITFSSKHHNYVHWRLIRRTDRQRYLCDLGGSKRSRVFGVHHQQRRNCSTESPVSFKPFISNWVLWWYFFETWRLRDVMRCDGRRQYWSCATSNEWIRWMGTGVSDFARWPWNFELLLQHWPR